ncbi:MAG: T9SS type A sorting domain-containing protein [bacterium]|nr:T9SS type A sorting domain-containing protein [bacterium]
MKLLQLLTFAFFTSSLSFGQVATCDGSRYASFSYIPSSSTGILYGNATTYGGSNQDLYLDFYEPTGDMAAERPLVIVAFGGSFISGTRQDMDWMCEYYTALGYTAATIDYRLYDGPLFPLPDSVAMTEEVLMAVSDMKAAIRFFKEDAATSNNYRVDTNNIFLGGISAGAITAAHAALLDSNDVIEAYIQPLLASNGGWTGNSSTNTQYTDNVRGVLNFSGALRKSSYVDANDPAVFSVHDDGDDVVPYAAGAASIAGFPIINMEGSFLIDQEAQNAGITTELITFPGTGHVSYFQGSNAVADSVLWESASFLYDIICPQYAQLSEVGESALTIAPNPTEGTFTVEWGEQKVQSIQLIDALGSVLTTVKPNGGTQTFDLNAFATGVYFLRIETMNGVQVETVQKM